MRTVFSALIIVDPKKAAEQLLDALVKSKMHKGLAAKKLGVSYGVFFAAMKTLGLEAKIAKLIDKATKEGWRHPNHSASPGRPKGSKDGQPRKRRTAEQAAAG